MKRQAGTLLAILAVCTVGGCSTGASAASNANPQCGISSDISASLNHGPTADFPGMTRSQEPSGAYPWDIGERQQDCH